MERKIGEIFEYNGEWYQCVVATQGCRECSFRTQDFCTRHPECMSTERSDNTSVIFKKLEKVGEPYLYEGALMQPYKRATGALICNWNSGYLLLEHGDSDIIDIEIKQNKEDMEEKKLNLKPFDLEAAKLGKSVCTRDGRKARIVCFDKKCLDEQILIVLVDCGKEESIYFYTTDGKCIDDFSSFDLMMLPEKKEGWVNVYNADTTFYYVDGRVFETKDEAVQEAKEEVEKEQREKNEYIDTIKVEWEE